MTHSKLLLLRVILNLQELICLKKNTTSAAITYAEIVTIIRSAYYNGQYLIIYQYFDSLLVGSVEYVW